MFKLDRQIYKTMKWLQQLPGKHIAGLYEPYSYKQVYARYGRMYATNGYILAAIEFERYQHAGDDGWKTVSMTEETDDSGARAVLANYHIYFTDHEEARSYNAFERQFVGTTETRNTSLTYNARLLTEALKPFTYFDLYPTMVFDKDRVQLTAHNDDVTIRIVVMGAR